MSNATPQCVAGCVPHMHVHDVQTDVLTNNPQWSPSEEKSPESDAHVRGPQRMTRVKAIAAVRARLAAVNAERKAKP